MLGVGVGTKFAMETLDHLISDDSATIFSQSKIMHDIYAQVWINVSVIFLSFIYCVMEISKPTDVQLGLQERGIIYILSFSLGIVFAFLNLDKHKLIKRVNEAALAIVGLCTVLLILEANISFFEKSPVATSFIFFIAAFSGVNIFVFLNKKFQDIKQKQQASLLENVEETKEASLEENLNSSEIQAEGVQVQTQHDETQKQSTRIEVVPVEENNVKIAELTSNQTEIPDIIKERKPRKPRKHNKKSSNKSLLSLKNMKS